MNGIRVISQQAYNHLLQILAKHGSKSKFSNVPLCDALVNNLPELFKSVIGGPRQKVTMLEKLKVY